MNKRLVWNFEIDSQDANKFPPLPHSVKEDYRWESRFFWPEESIITLHGLSDSFLNLASYESKQREDIYYVLASKDYNLKQRRDELLYKPLLKETDLMQGFGKKINLSNHDSDYLLPGITPILKGQLMHLIQTDGQPLTVKKIALSYSFDSEPKIKLELSRLMIEQDIYFSLCVEGKSAQLVQLISHRLLKGQPSCDYVRFLKQRDSHV